MAEELADPITIFYCYARKDQELRNQLDDHLTGLRRANLIMSWYDGEIIPGVSWEKEIEEHLNTAQIILLLISPDFIKSDYCYSKEMTIAIQRHNSNESHVIPVLIRPVDWSDAPFAELQMLPSDAKPVTLWLNQDAAFENIAKGIRKVVKELAAKQRSQAYSSKEDLSAHPLQLQQDPFVVMGDVLPPKYTSDEPSDKPNDFRLDTSLPIRPLLPRHQEDEENDIQKDKASSNAIDRSEPEDKSDKDRLGPSGVYGVRPRSSRTGRQIVPTPEPQEVPIPPTISRSLSDFRLDDTLPSPIRPLSYLEEEPDLWSDDFEKENGAQEVSASSTISTQSKPEDKSNKDQISSSGVYGVRPRSSRTGRQIVPTPGSQEVPIPPTISRPLSDEDALPPIRPLSYLEEEPDLWSDDFEETRRSRSINALPMTNTRSELTNKSNRTRLARASTISPRYVRVSQPQTTEVKANSNTTVIIIGVIIGVVLIILALVFGVLFHLLWLLWILDGIFVGFCASVILRGGGYGIVGDVIVGMIGAIIGGIIVSLLSVNIISNLLLSSIGACILIALLRFFSGDRRKL